jgi:hypothetical protein
MNAAQCAAIHEGAKEVSQSLIDGFFGTITTELSQQLQALDSAINAGLGLLLEQGKAVSKQTSVMETDYNRISSRYMNLFKDLDTECYKRIFALDKNSFLLSEQVQNKLLSEGLEEGAKNYITLQEESASRMMITVSGLVRKVRDVMQTLFNYIIQETKLSSLIGALLSGEEIQAPEYHSLPVVFTESDVLNGNGDRVECFFANEVQNKTDIIDAVIPFCKDPALSSWDALAEDEKEILGRELSSIAENNLSGSSDEPRVYDVLMKLWQNSNLFTMTRRK